MIVYLGVTDKQYPEVFQQTQGTPKTTGKVAEELEEQFGVMHKFVELCATDIIVAASIADACVGVDYGDGSSAEELRNDLKNAWKDYLTYAKHGITTTPRIMSAAQKLEAEITREGLNRHPFIWSGLYANSFSVGVFR